MPLNSGINNIVAKGGPAACVFFNPLPTDIVRSPLVGGSNPSALASLKACAKPPAACVCDPSQLLPASPNDFDAVNSCPTDPFRFTVPQFTSNCGAVPDSAVSVEVAGPGGSAFGPTAVAALPASREVSF